MLKYNNAAQRTLGGRMHDYSNCRLSDQLINLTDQILCGYEESTGEIIKFIPPNNQKLPEQPSHEPNSPITHYILEKDDAIKLARTGRPLDDIAVIYDAGYGRGGIKITYLHWGNNPNVKVCLYKDAYLREFPHL